ncbi:MAG: HU family DNA-binding protein, partial [Muribaculaceae bacterium]|nr:HU family DNA-binding protein [Muribaculaceae bacterium]
MNKKLTFPELAELLSVATNTSKRMSELFLRELFATIAQSLIEGDSVKVKGLGVFKVSDVSSRKSIDVNTGQAIEIAGHKKITFTPDKSMAEAVNASFACFEAVVLDDDVTNEMIQEIDDEVAAPLADATSQSEAEELPAENAASAEEPIETVEVPEETAENAVTPPPFNISEIESGSTAPEPEPEEEAEEPAVAVEPEPAEPVEESQPEPEVAEPEPEEVVIVEEVPAEAAEAEESQPEPDGQEPDEQPIAAMPQEQAETAVDQQEDNSEELGGEEDSYDEDKHRRYRGRHRRRHSKSWY